MWPPVIWVGKWLLKEAVMTVAVHYGTKFVKSKLKGKGDAERDSEEVLAEREGTSETEVRKHKGTGTEEG